MAIILRNVDGMKVALCAVECDPQHGDIYIDDGYHTALSAKFAQDHQIDGGGDAEYPELWAVMETQKVRDAQEEMEKWLKEREKQHRELKG